MPKQYGKKSQTNKTLKIYTMENTTLTTAEAIHQIIDIINDMDCADLVQLNNEYCEAINGMDSTIYSNDDDFLEDYFNTKADLARAITYGDFRYMDNWVRFDGYGNLESFNYMSKDQLCELVEVIAEYICENPSEFTQFEEIDFDSVDDYMATIEQDEKRYSDNKK